MTERDIKQSLGRRVRHADGTEYRLTGATIRKDTGGAYWYQAELQDLTALRSVRICRLEDIELVNGQGDYKIQ